MIIFNKMITRHGRTIYINIESSFKMSMIKDIKKIITKYINHKWYKNIVIRSWLMINKHETDCRQFIKNICIEYNTECIIQNKNINDAIGTASVKLINLFKIKIPKYKKVGYCKIKLS